LFTRSDVLEFGDVIIVQRCRWKSGKQLCVERKHTTTSTTTSATTTTPFLCGEFADEDLGCPGLAHLCSALHLVAQNCPYACGICLVTTTGFAVESTIASTIDPTTAPATITQTTITTTSVTQTATTTTICSGLLGQFLAPFDNARMTRDGHLLTIANVQTVEVRCAFSNRILHSRMPLDPTHVRLKRTCV
jgi:hypothetical protein